MGLLAVAVIWRQRRACATDLPQRRPGRQGHLFRPAAAGRQCAASAPRSRWPTGAATATALCPYELRQVVAALSGDAVHGRRTAVLAARAGRCCRRRGIPFTEKTVKHQRGHRRAAAAERARLAAVPDHRRPAAQGLLRRRMVAVPRCGGLSQDARSCRPATATAAGAAAGGRSRPRPAGARAARPSAAPRAGSAAGQRRRPSNPAGIRF